MWPCVIILSFQGGGKPIVSQLVKFTGICVGLYLFLSGYGLYITYQRNPNIQPWKRIVKLYLNFWIVFAIFISLGAWLYPNRYPGSCTAFLNNVTGWHTTYNGEWWFLFPYVLLVLSAKWIFKVINRLDLWLQISDRDLCDNCFGQLFYGISD